MKNPQTRTTCFIDKVPICLWAPSLKLYENGFEKMYLLFSLSLDLSVVLMLGKNNYTKDNN